jgi:peptidyl-tRNA hydrolase
MSNSFLDAVHTADPTEKDPLVMYLVIRESLDMSQGKISIQTGHATMLITLAYMKEMSEARFVSDLGYSDRLNLFDKWLKTAYRKISLTADEKEWHKVQESFVEGHTRFTVVDCGLTEVPTGSETVMVIWPMYKSQRPKAIKRLQSLK